MSGRPATTPGHGLRAAWLSRTAATLACACAALCLLASGARADVFGSISLASEGSFEGGSSQQAEYAHDAAISGDGRYVAFDGRFGGREGVWRRDLSTGAVELVAAGEAALPSISQTGRYISFTSAEDYVSGDGARGVNVWVRDMEPEAGEPEFVLASAVNGSSTAPDYEFAASPSQEERELGAVAAGRSAIDAAGDEVAFVTTAPSNLLGSATPKLQVLVRYLKSERTVLVSRCFECEDSSEAVSVQYEGQSFGAVYPDQLVAFGMPPANGLWGHSYPPGASISADGSTVAWMGEDIARQAAMLPAERTQPLYTEPLWRRIEPGSETITERVTGGSEPDNPACLASGEQSLPTAEAQSPSDPCQGPFEVLTNNGENSGSSGIWATGDSAEGNYIPRLSANGYTVAFLSSALRTGEGEGFGDTDAGQPPELYLADMNPALGLTRVQALRTLTVQGGTSAAYREPITDFDISANGQDLAFTTERTQFPLGSPAFITAPAPEAGENELYDIDLESDTLTRVTHGYGSPSEASEQTLYRRSKTECEGEEQYCGPRTIGAQSPSYSEDGRLLAFSSTASNLVYGDGNAPTGEVATGSQDGSDAFVVPRTVFVAEPTPNSISAEPTVRLAPEWELGVTASGRADGQVVLDVSVPGAGTLSAAAGAVVLVAQGRSRHGQRLRPATRTVAAAGHAIAGASAQIVPLTLSLGSRYASLAGRQGGLSAIVTVSFAAPGHETLRQRIDVSFTRAARAARTSRRARRARHRGARR